MADWHYKRMDTLAAISKRAADDVTLPSPAREMFLISHELANTSNHFDQTDHARLLDRAFTAMCGACRQANLHLCTPPDTTFQRCRLIVAHLA